MSGSVSADIGVLWRRKSGKGWESSFNVGIQTYPLDYEARNTSASYQEQDIKVHLKATATTISRLSRNLFAPGPMATEHPMAKTLRGKVHGGAREVKQ